MLASRPPERDKEERLVWEPQLVVAKPNTIWYSRARVKQEIGAALRPTPASSGDSGTSILEPFTVLRASLAPRGPLRLGRRLNSPRRRPN
jgi:hypothetical protein